MTHITDFYREQKPDHRGRMLATLWDFGFNDLEGVHDYIQWLFPLPDPSQFNPYAPILTAEDCQAFANDPVLQANFDRSYFKMLDFYGLQRDRAGHVAIGPAFDSRRLNWITPGNHNFLRLTRIIQAVALLKNAAEANALFDALAGIFQQYEHIIGNRTFSFWKNAVTKHL